LDDVPKANAAVAVAAPAIAVPFSNVPTKLSYFHLLPLTKKKVVNKWSYLPIIMQLVLDDSRYENGFF